MHGIHQQVGSMCSRMPQALGGDAGRLRFRELRAFWLLACELRLAA